MLGVAHVGVSVDQIEYWFDHKGIHKETPMAHVCTLGGRYVERHTMGSVNYTDVDIDRIFINSDKGKGWGPGNYNIFGKNCISFAKAFVKALLWDHGEEKIWPRELNKLNANLRRLPELIANILLTPSFMLNKVLKKVRRIVKIKDLDEQMLEANKKALIRRLLSQRGHLTQNLVS